MTMTTLTTPLRWLLNLIIGNPLLFWAAVVANMLGAIIGGVVWYGPMLLAAPVWAWPFIPDCPLASLLGTIALFDARAGRSRPWFAALTAFFCIKYGVWTLAFWLQDWSQTRAPQPVEIMLFITHIGLICEGLLFTTRIGRIGIGAKLAVIGWFALSLVVDYGFGYHPPLTLNVPVESMLLVAATLTALLGGALLLWPGTRHESVAVRA